MSTTPFQKPAVLETRSTSVIKNLPAEVQDAIRDYDRVWADYAAGLVTLRALMGAKMALLHELTKETL
jgi:hypothetical protein